MLRTISSLHTRDTAAQGTQLESVIRRRFPALVPILLLYVGLAFYRIDQQSFWGDEISSINGASGVSLLGLWSAGHGPLYHILLHFWLRLGQTEFVARSLSAIFAIAAVSLVYALGLRLVDRRYAATAATLFATSPFLIWYSQETRYITLAITTVLLSMYSFHRALSTDSLKFWLLYALATGAALFTFVPNVFVVMSQGIYVVSIGELGRILRWLKYLTGVMFVFGIWLAVVYGGVSVENITGSAAPVDRIPLATLDTGTPRELSAGVLPYTFLAFSSGFSVGPSIQELHISRGLPSLLQHVSTLALPTLLFGSLFFFGIFQLYRQTPLMGFLLLWVVIPILAVLVISATTNVAYNVRYASAAMPAYILILAAGIAKARARAVQLGLLLAVLLVNAWSLSQYYFNPRYAKADARAAARYMESMGNSRDVILLVGNSGAFRHYYQGNLRIVQWSRSVNSNRDSVSKNVQDLAKGYDRLWLVTIRPWETDPTGNVKSVVDQSFEDLHEVTLPGVRISSYAAKLPRS